MKTIGSRREVWYGSAKKTSGGLEKKDLVKNKIGRLVSKKKLNHSKDPNKNPLLKIGYQQKKGSKIFGPLKVVTKNNELLKKNRKKNNKELKVKTKNSSWWSKLIG